MAFGLYTMGYENIFKVLYKATCRNLYSLVGCFNRFGLDGANNVHDEVLVELWRGFVELSKSDFFDGTFYNLYYRAFRYFHCYNFRLQ